VNWSGLRPLACIESSEGSAHAAPEQIRANE
jgi:hypothetical protein